MEEQAPWIALQGAVQLGRDATFRLRDRRVSRVHCVVEARSNGAVVRDLRSRNGTFVNGVRLAPGEASPMRAGDVLRLGDSVCVLAACPHRPAALPSPIVGSSAALHSIGATVRRLGPTSLTVLLQGETGVGKEVVAQALHDASRRAGAFVPVNVSALPADLFESELFGHTQGAFTGASRASPGLVMTAAGGTLFLDEIGELPLPAQAKLLRVLDTRRVRAVGATHERPVDARVVAATNVPLSDAVAQGRFRADLYARLTEEIVPIPPLRERVEDVPVLLEAFLRSEGAMRRRWTASFVERLLLHRWPGNVRELRSLARRLATYNLGPDHPFDAEHAPAVPAERRDASPEPLEDGQAPEAHSSPFDAPAPLTRAHGAQRLDTTPLGAAGAPDAQTLIGWLEAHGGNVRSLAHALGKDRRQVYRWLARAGLAPDRFRR